MRTILTALAATGLVTVALIGCQPAASPTDSVAPESMGTESMGTESMGAESMAPTESASPSP
jgi:hypothetical protein